jgi:hypothetical protein
MKKFVKFKNVEVGAYIIPLYGIWNDDLAKKINEKQCFNFHSNSIDELDEDFSVAVIETKEELEEIIKGENNENKQ